MNTINQTAPERSIGWGWGRSRRLGSQRTLCPVASCTPAWVLGTQDYVWHFTRAPSSLPIILAAAAPSWRNRIRLAKRVARNPPVSRSFLPHLQTEFGIWKLSCQADLLSVLLYRITRGSGVRVCLGEAVANPFTHDSSHHTGVWALR